MKKLMKIAPGLILFLSLIMVLHACDDKNSRSEVTTLPQWKVIADFDDFYPASVYFTDYKNGYIAGAIIDSNSTLVQGLILTTNDMGKTWSEFTFDSLPPLSCIYVTDSGIGFVAGGNRILKTIDSGLNWSTVFMQDGWFIQSLSYAFGNKVLAVDLTGKILASYNGGNNWLPRTGITSCQLYSVCSYSFDAPAIAVGYTNSAEHQNGIILRTTDDGNTWDSIPFAGSIMPCSVVNGEYQGDFLTAGGNSILRSTDGGISWNQVFYASDVILNAISITETGSGFAIGQNGTILKTTDNGANWLYDNRIIEDPLLSVHMQDVNRAFVTSFNPKTKKARLLRWN